MAKRGVRMFKLFRRVNGANCGCGQGCFLHLWYLHVYVRYGLDRVLVCERVIAWVMVR